MPLLKPGLNISNIPAGWVYRTLRCLNFQETQRLYPAAYPRSPLVQPGEKTLLEGGLDSFFQLFNYTSHLTISPGDSWTHLARWVEKGSMGHIPLFVARVENLVLEVKIKCGVHDLDGVSGIVRAMVRYPRLKVVHVKLILPKGWVNADDGELYQYCLQQFASRKGWTIEVSVLWVDYGMRLARWLQNRQVR